MYNTSSNRTHWLKDSSRMATGPSITMTLPVRDPRRRILTMSDRAKVGISMLVTTWFSTNRCFQLIEMSTISYHPWKTCPKWPTRATGSISVSGCRITSNASLEECNRICCSVTSDSDHLTRSSAAILILTVSEFRNQAILDYILS